jgi:hypothetical protein
MKKGTLGYCIIAGVLIIGCAVFFIGRKIRNRQEKTDTGEIVESEDTLVDISEAYDVDELLASDYDNIELPSSLDVEKVEAVSNVILKVPDYEEQNKKLDIKFFQDNLQKMGYKYDEQYVIDDKGKTYPYGRYYNDEKLSAYIATGCTGFFVVDSINTYDYETVEEFYVDAPYEDDEHEIIGGSMKVSEAVEMYEKLETECIAELGYDIPVPKVFRVRIVKNENQQLRYEMDTRMSYNGVPVIGVGDKYSRSGFGYEVLKGTSSGTVSGKKITDGIKVSYYGFPTEYVSDTPIDKVISVKKACDLVNVKLSAYRKNKLLNVKMEYLPFFEKETDEENHSGIEWTGLQSGNKFRLKPYWVFVFDSTTDNEIIGLVDCVTGEVGLVYNQ